MGHVIPTIMLLSYSYSIKSIIYLTSRPINSHLQAASTTWVAEFLRLESNTTDINGERYNIVKRLTIKDEIFENILSDPTYPVVLFSTVRHPLERYRWCQYGQLKVVCRLVSAYHNKFEEDPLFIENSPFISKYGNLTFPQFAKIVIAESQDFGTNFDSLNNHWRPLYLSGCGFCNVPFTGYYH